MPNIYLVPGLVGSELLSAQRPPLGPTLWLSYTRIALGHMGRTRLGPDGVSPAEGYGVLCTPGRPLPDFYTQWSQLLDEQLSGQGYNTLQHGYDWRLHPSDNGDSLANRIRSDTTADEPAVIIGHSMGGLVARFAWRSLVRTDETALIRRIITLGTPHWGSYQIEELWSFLRREIQLIWGLTQIGERVWTDLAPPPDPGPWTPDQVVRLTQTWPGCYDLLPNPAQPGVGSDPLRYLLWDAANWPAARRPVQEWLDYAHDVTFPALVAANTRPPASVLTTVATTNIPTQVRLQSAAALGSFEALVLDGFGDGVVGTASALLEGSTQVTVDGVGHSDLPGAVARSGQLAALVLAVNPDAPGPPRGPLPVVANQLLGSVPFADRQTLGYYGQGRYVQVPRDDP
jgi:pimeloyl-ACP methyl ester carboxylesterase